MKTSALFFAWLRRYLKSKPPLSAHQKRVRADLLRRASELDARGFELCTLGDYQRGVALHKQSVNLRKTIRTLGL